jgi:hypothetical protein
MTDSNHVMAEIAWLSRRGRAAAPAIHPLRTAACPPLGALACGLLTDRQRIHVEGCRHCRSVRQAAAQPKTGFAPAAVRTGPLRPAGGSSGRADAARGRGDLACAAIAPFEGADPPDESPVARHSAARAV